MSFDEPSDKKLHYLIDILTDGGKEIKEYVYQVLTDHISIESSMDDIICLYFCNDEKLTAFQEIIIPRLSFDKKLEILDQLLKIANLETDYGYVTNDIRSFSRHRNAIAHRRRGYDITQTFTLDSDKKKDVKTAITLDLSRKKDGKTQKNISTESTREEIIHLGIRCVRKSNELVEVFRKKYP